MNPIDAATLWLRGQLQRLAEFARLMTRSERALAGVLLVDLFVTTVLGLLTGSGAAWGGFAVSLMTAWLLAPVLVDAVLARTHIGTLDLLLQEAREVAITANATKATGAPRVAEVPCSHGVMQRFVYGPDGWAPAGPAPDTRHEEAHTS